MYDAPNITDKPRPLPSFANGAYGMDNYFRKEADKPDLYSCREDFHNAGGIDSETRGFYFGAAKPFRLSAMFDWVENTLNVRPDCRTELYLCQKDATKPLARPSPGDKYTVVYVKLGSFWKAELIRWYFSTVVCRAANFKFSMPHKTFMELSYTRNTRYATAKFLDGFTILSGPHRKTKTNWVEELSYTGNAKRLIRPSLSDEVKFFVDEDPISNLDPEEKWDLLQWVHESEPFDF